MNTLQGKESRVIFILCIFRMVLAANFGYYHELAVETFQPPSTLREDSYFGFSSTYDQYNKRMIISAPKKNDIGEVYECDLKKITKTSCSILPHNITRESKLYTDNYWFGATVKAGPTFVMACTPRYVSVTAECENDIGMFGRCYMRKESERSFSTTIAPVRITPQKVKYEGKDVCVKQEKLMDSLGWSMDIGENDSLIVGSPAMYSKTGIAAILPRGKDVLQRIQNIDSKIYNFGYSVAIGYFTNEEQLSYAVSTTYGSVGPGAVYFYTYTEDHFDPYMTLSKSVDINMVGSMFGAVLCTAKMKKVEKGDDLLVGAPTYALDSGYDIGAVYVYGYNKKGTPPVYRRKIVGQKFGSMFGSAIISVGDLNGDGRDEIAIGAPFEDAGAVYLYSGAAIFSDSPLTWLQRITPTDKNINSFGYSLSALQDYDDNGCNELAVGVPYEDRVMLYKCLAAVTIGRLYTIFPNVQNRTVSRQTDFVFQVCMDIQYPKKIKNVIADIITDVKMTHLYATLKTPNEKNVYSFKTSLSIIKTTYCENVGFVLPLDKDYSTPIGYEIVTKLGTNPFTMEHVTGGHVTLSEKSQLSYSDVLWAAECSGARECISNLSLTVTSNVIDLPLLTGSMNKAAFSVKILNTGDVAYDPCVQFSISGGTLPKPPMYCSKDKTLDEIWVCKPTKPIVMNHTWDMEDIVVDLQDLTNLDTAISLNLELLDRCTDKNDSTSYVHRIPLTSNFDGIYIKGTTDIGENIYIPEAEIVFPTYFKHIYTIINKGPTNFKDLTSIVKMQNTSYIIYPDTPVSVYVEATSQTSSLPGADHKCKVFRTVDGEITATCRIDYLLRDNYVRVAISMETDPNFLTYEILKKLDNVTVSSTLSVHYEKNEKHKSLITLLQLQEAFVDIWILIAAGLVGLVLIIILAVILYTSGFLQRKNKKKLENLKKDVKRQSVRRSMMPQARTERTNIEPTEEITLLQ